MNHGVLVVGTSSGWWKIKNSWGNAWGEKGFIRIAGGNTCGVCKAGVYPFKWFKYNSNNLYLYLELYNIYIF